MYDTEITYNFFITSPAAPEKVAYSPPVGTLAKRPISSYFY